MDKSNSPFAESIYNLGIDTVVKELSMLKMIELDKEIISIEHKSSNNLFQELEEKFEYGEGMFMKVADFRDNLIEGIFFLHLLKVIKL